MIRIAMVEDEAAVREQLMGYVQRYTRQYGSTIAEISMMTHRKFIISRVWRGEQVIVPEADTVLHTNDNVLVVTNKDEAAAQATL